MFSVFSLPAKKHSGLSLHNLLYKDEELISKILWISLVKVFRLIKKHNASKLSFNNFISLFLKFFNKYIAKSLGPMQT